MPNLFKILPLLLAFNGMEFLQNVALLSKNEIELISNINRLLNDKELRSSLGKAAREYVKKNNGIENTADVILSLVSKKAVDEETNNLILTRNE